MFITGLLDGIQPAPGYSETLNLDKQGAATRHTMLVSDVLEILQERPPTVTVGVTRELNPRPKRVMSVPPLMDPRVGSTESKRAIHVYEATGRP